MAPGQPGRAFAGRSPVASGVEFRRGARCDGAACDHQGSGRATGSPSGGPADSAGALVVCHRGGIGSAREVARLCDEDIAFEWLCGGVGMNAKTLADFRVDHGAVLECLLVDSFTALVRAGVASLDRVAQDGVRVRASAGAASFRRHSTLQECRCEAEKAVHDLRTQLDTDPGAASRKQAAARRRATEDRERRVRAALAVTEELQAKQQEAACREAERAAKRAAAADANGEEPASKKPREKEPRASTTDAQA